MKTPGENEVTAVKEALTKQMGEAKGSLKGSLGQLLMKVRGRVSPSCTRPTPCWLVGAWGAGIFPPHSFSNVIFSIYKDFNSSCREN